MLPPPQPFYVVECEAGELPDFHEKRSELIPEKNLRRVERIFPQDGHHDSQWYGSVRSWEEAAKVLRQGWPEGAQQAKDLAEIIGGVLPEPESVRRRVRWSDDDGGELDRDKLYTSGIEGAFRSTTKVKQRATRSLRIVANWSISAWFTASQLAWNGAAIVALVDLLEAADYRVELSLALPVQQHGGNRSISMPVVRIKRSQDPLDVNAVAAVAGHAGIYRSFGFAAICSSPHKIGDTLGACLQVKQAWEQAVKAGVCESVDAYMETSHDAGSAVERIFGVLRQIFPDMDADKVLQKEAMRKAAA